jgi:hypothetical protein
MGPILADTASHRPRFVWLAAALAATITLFVLHHPRRHHHRHTPVQLQRIGHCVDQMSSTPSVPAYYYR